MGKKVRVILDAEIELYSGNGVYKLKLPDADPEFAREDVFVWVRQDDMIFHGAQPKQEISIAPYEPTLIDTQQLLKWVEENDDQS